MAVESLFSEKGVTIGVWHLTESLEELEKAYRCHDYEESLYSSFRNQRRKREWLTTRLLLQELLNEQPFIVYNDEGAPFIEGWNVSITHASEYVAVILSKTQKVGIDIENTNRRIAPVLSKFISPKEIDLLNVSPTDISFNFWCAKEALFKLVPDKGIDFKTQMDLVKLNDSASCGKIIFHSSTSQSSEYLVQFRHFKNFLMAWIVE